MNKIFNLELTKEHPIIKNHRIQGQFIFPGLAYIDMLYKLAEEGINLEYKDYSLKNLSIFNPLNVSADSPTKIKISFEKKKKDWAVKIERDNPGEQDNPFLYATAELSKGKINLDEHIDITAIKKSSKATVDIETAYMEAREANLIHSNLFKAKGNAYLTEESCLIDIRLDETAVDETQNFTFHPTLIDGAGAASILLLNQYRPDNIGKNDLFIPLSYEKFYSTNPLKDHCYVRINLSSIRYLNEIIVMDMDFFNPEGNNIAILKGITSKRIRYREQIKPGSKKKQQSKIENKIKTPDSDANEAKKSDKKMDVSDLEASLKRIFKKYLPGNINYIDIDTGFFELGLESSQLLMLVKDIEDTFEISVSPSLLFEYNNLKELGEHLKTEMGNKRDENDIKNIPDSRHSHTAMGNIILTTGSYEFYENEPYIYDHLVYEKPSLMGVTYPCLVLETYIKNNPDAYPVRLRNVQFFGGPVGLDKNEKVSVNVKFNEKNGRIDFKTTQYVNKTAAEKLSCTGDASGRVDAVFDPIDIDALIDRSKPIDMEKMGNYYSAFNDFTIGPMLQAIESLFEYDDNIHICKVNLTGKRKKGNVSSLIFDPLLLSSSYMIIFPGAINSVSIDKIAGNFFVPLTIENLTVYRPMTDTAYIVNKLRVEKQDFISFDAAFLTEAGDIIAEIINAAVTLVKSPAQLKNINPASSRSFSKNNEDTKIAIIGVSGRYPGARSVAEFWDNLKEGKDCITEIPVNRWNWQEYFDEKRNQPGKIYCKWGGFIEGVDEFDPLFFNILPREAEAMDPQERLFLECAYETLEDAGYTRESMCKDHRDLGGNVGVFVGVMYEEYQLYGAQAQAQGMMVALTGNPSSIANRVSYVLNFHGPSMAVDTMCSSALTALHLACRSIQNGECEAAIAGGVNVSIHPNKYLLLSQGNFASSKGRCESFGKGGDGYVPGEGVGAVILKPLSQAIKDGDHIYGVVRSSMLNAGGKTSGYSVPNPAAQGAVISMAFERAKIDPRKISYIEAHGTGTSLGDPIEINGLSRVFRKYTQDRQFCAIGSVKSNVGHLESAAGIAALTKVLLQLKHKKLVPSLHAKELNPNIDFEQSPFKVQRELTEWKGDYPRTAGISSFGAGGSNAHIIIEEYLDEKSNGYPGITRENPAVIVLSAKNKERLKEYAKELLSYIDREGYHDDNLADIAYTLQVGREGLDVRLGFTTSTINEMKEKLKAYINDLEGVAQLYRGNLRQNEDTFSFLRGLDKEIGEAIEKWIKGKDYNKVLELWVRGFAFDWNRLYDDKKPKRISLPTYPFAREKFWIKKVTADRSIIQQKPPEVVQDGNPFLM